MIYIVLILLVFMYLFDFYAILTHLVQHWSGPTRPMPERMGQQGRIATDPGLIGMLGARRIIGNTDGQQPAHHQQQKYLAHDFSSPKNKVTRKGVTLNLEKPTSQPVKRSAKIPLD